MLPLGHQLSMGLAHLANPAVQIVQAQWIDGILAPQGPRPLFCTDFQSGKRNSLKSASASV